MPEAGGRAQRENGLAADMQSCESGTHAGSKGRQIFSRKERVERVITPPVVVPELPAADGKSESKD